MKFKPKHPFSLINLGKLNLWYIVPFCLIVNTILIYLRNYCQKDHTVLLLQLYHIFKSFFIATFMYWGLIGLLLTLVLINLNGFDKSSIYKSFRAKTNIEDYEITMIVSSVVTTIFILLSYYLDIFTFWK